MRKTMFVISTRADPDPNRRVSQRIVDAILDRDLIAAVAFENNGNVF